MSTTSLKGCALKPLWIANIVRERCRAPQATASTLWNAQLCHRRPSLCLLTRTKDSTDDIPWSNSPNYAALKIEQLSKWQTGGFGRPCGRSEKKRGNLALAGKCFGAFVVGIVPHARANFYCPNTTCSSILPAHILQAINLLLRRFIYSISLCFSLCASRHVRSNQNEGHWWVAIWSPTSPHV